VGIGATTQSELSFAFRLTAVVQLDNLIPFKSYQGKLLDVPDEIIQAFEAIALISRQRSQVSYQRSLLSLKCDRFFIVKTWAEPG
jgi:hypothetical protein